MRLHFALAFAAVACQVPTFSIETPVVDACVQQTQAQGKTCGGACPVCGLGDACELAADCASTVCTAGVCVLPAPPPACDDGLKNGDETDVDCGGSCTACNVNQHCSASSDCATLVCASVCQPANCTDGVRNGSESALDCGGSCAGCATGQSCNSGSDCETGSCSKGACLAATCSDQVKNGTETDVDCGGACSPCKAGEGCLKAADCDSLSCASNHHCAAPSCRDGIQNGSETDVDCGPGCTACMQGQTCTAGTDCSTGSCGSGYCLPTQPTGAQLDRTGWAATASASTNDSTPNDALDGKASTRWASGSPQVVGMFFELDMQKPQIFFSFTLDSTDSPGDAPALFDVYLSMDGTFKTPALSAQVGSATTQVTFPSAQIARYIKIVLTQSKSSNWWGIRELNVNY